MAREPRRTPQSPADRCRRYTEMIAETTGQAWTFGYIGNCGPGYDDRSWYAFRRTGEVGTAADRIGGFGTDHLDSLAHVLHGAARMARMRQS